MSINFFKAHRNRSTITNNQSRQHGPTRQPSAADRRDGLLNYGTRPFQPGPSSHNNHLSPHINQLAERLFAQVASICPTLAGKITGMLLELPLSQLLMLLSSQESLKGRVNEAVTLLLGMSNLNIIYFLNELNLFH